ncbi:MAG: RluA family pseudouridine synthase [Magnetococcus sp. WYHC-3]
MIPPELAGERLDKALAMLVSGMSRAELQRLIGAGAVQVDGQLEQRPSRVLRGGEQVHVAVPAPQPVATCAEDLPLTVLFEDAHLVVIDKPPGLVVHPAPGNREGTLVNALLHHCRDASGATTLSGIGGELRPGIVHRLDKDTGGVLVVAKSAAAHQGLAEQFAAHSVVREYWALVKGLAPAQGTVDAPLGRHPVQRTRMAVVMGGRRAVTHFRRLRVYPGLTLVACRLETGRTHQIRVHMAHVRHPLLGDPDYGRRFDPPRDWPEGLRRLAGGFARQALHARLLGFVHPVSGEVLRFETPPAPDLAALLQALEAVALPGAAD